MEDIKPKIKLKLKDMAKRQGNLFGFTSGGDKSGSSSAGGGKRRASTEASRRRMNSDSWWASQGSPF